MKKKSSRQGSLSINSRERAVHTKSSFLGSSDQQNDQQQQKTKAPQQNENQNTPQSKDKKNKGTDKWNQINKAGGGTSQDKQFSLININQVHTFTLGRCGYCQNTKWMTSGFDCAQMSLNDYQLLMDRGWRRCGTYYYKPHVDVCCCRTFSIRLDAGEYKQGNSQKKVIRKFESMLNKQDEKIEAYKKDSSNKDIQNDNELKQSNQKKTILNMYEEYDMDDEDEDDEDYEDLLSQNPIRSQSEKIGGPQNQYMMQNSQKQTSILTSGSISNKIQQIKDGSIQNQSSSENIQPQNNELQVKGSKQQSMQPQRKDSSNRSKPQYESLLLSTDDSLNQNCYMSQIDQEIMNEIKDRTWQVLQLFLNNIKNNLTIFLDALGLPLNEKTQQLIFDERIMEQSRLYQNKNMIKHGTHSTNFLITFYRVNTHAWGEYFNTKEKFFSKSYSYFEAAFDCANQELVKKNIRLKLRTCGEINVHYMKRSFLKRVSELTSLKSSKKSMISGNISSSSTLSQTHRSMSSAAITKKKKQTSFIIPDRRKIFDTQIVRAEFNEQSYELYKRYNKIIHNNMKTSKESYKNFLCQNGLRNVSIENGKGKVLNCGCYHFKYYLDGILIAVSVVDILPECLSSVYYFYEPDMKKYSLGVIGNLRDIDYIKEMNVYFPNFRYYYLGYYIHNNSKMSYKASYKPFELLCPITYRWVMYDKVTQDSIHEGESPRLCLKEKIIDDMDFEKTDIEKYVQQKVKLYISGQYIKINQIKQSFITYFQFLLSKLVTLLGKQLSESLVFGQE